MDEKLIDVFERWLQGRINTCVMGLVSRIERLEAAPAALNSDDLVSNTFNGKVREMVRNAVEDHDLASNSDLRTFVREAFSDVRDIVQDVIDEEKLISRSDMYNFIDEQNLVSRSDMYDFIRENVRVELDVSRD